MTTHEIPVNTVVHAAQTALSMNDVAAGQVSRGRPQTGTAVVGAFGGLEVGTWEMTSGAMRDIEVEELFVVIAGNARVEFDDGSAALELSTGDVVRLAAGARTVWTVRERLRKVYLAGK